MKLDPNEHKLSIREIKLVLKVFFKIKFVCNVIYYCEGSAPTIQGTIGYVSIKDKFFPERKALAIISNNIKEDNKQIVSTIREHFPLTTLKAEQYVSFIEKDLSNSLQVLSEDIDCVKDVGQFMIDRSSSLIKRLEKYKEDWISDGSKKRLFHLSSWFGKTIDVERTNAYLATHLIGQISRLLYPGCNFPYMLCLSGKQGCGKSTFIEKMALDKNKLSTDFNPNELEKELEELLSLNLVFFDEELRQNHNTKETMKRLISTDKSSVRTYYTQTKTKIPKGFVLAHATNERNFISEVDGERRSLVVAFEEYEKLPSFVPMRLPNGRMSKQCPPIAAYRELVLGEAYHYVSECVSYNDKVDLDLDLIFNIAGSSELVQFLVDDNIKEFNKQFYKGASTDNPQRVLAEAIYDTMVSSNYKTWKRSLAVQLLKGLFDNAQLKHESNLDNFHKIMKEIGIEIYQVGGSIHYKLKENKVVVPENGKVSWDN